MPAKDPGLKNTRLRFSHPSFLFPLSPLKYLLFLPSFCRCSPEFRMQGSQDQRSRSAKPVTIHGLAQSGDLVGFRSFLRENPSLVNEINPIVRYVSRMHSRMHFNQLGISVIGLLGVENLCWCQIVYVKITFLAFLISFNIGLMSFSMPTFV